MTIRKKHSMLDASRAKKDKNSRGMFFFSGFGITIFFIFFQHFFALKEFIFNSCEFLNIPLIFTN